MSESKAKKGASSFSVSARCASQSPDFGKGRLFGYIVLSMHLSRFWRNVLSAFMPGYETFMTDMDFPSPDVSGRPMQRTQLIL